MTEIDGDTDHERNTQKLLPQLCFPFSIKSVLIFFNLVSFVILSRRVRCVLGLIQPIGRMEVQKSQSQIFGKMTLRQAPDLIPCKLHKSPNF